jgi:septal ring factor EnvC (AmiA/AmiB activator)
VELKKLYNKISEKISLIGFAVPAFALCSLIILGATYDEIVNDKNKQIEHIQKGIDRNKHLAGVNSGQLEALNKSIDSINTALATLNDFLKDYKGETYLSAEQIAIETNMVIFLEEEVERIQNSFRNKVISLYKHGKDYELELLLSAKSPNEFLRRNEYLQKFAENRKKQLQELRSKEYMLSEKKKMLDLSTSSRRFYVESKRNEKTALEEKINTLNAKKNSIEFQSNALNLKTERLESDLNSIKSFLENFADYKNKFKPTKSVRLNYSTDNLDSLKGKLNSPLDISLIRNEFGILADNSTNTQSFNKGVDFSIAYGSRVFAVAPGTVTLVGETPFYGNVVIINHANNYHTVYAEMSDITVKPGDKIRLNQIIGKTGENIDGQGFHFEIWKGKTPLNPAEWIRL